MTLERSSCGSEVVVMDDGILQTVDRTQPAIAQLNVTKSSRVHIGPKFVSVTQNVDKTEVVKGRILGLELVSPQNTKRLRCSIAVFVCWAFVVASALMFFIFYYALAKQATRLDLDLPFYRYIWDVAKSTTKAERVSCAAAMLLLIVCILLIVYFTVIAKPKPVVNDVAPHEWFITRDQWLAANNVVEQESNDAYKPLKLVIIAHTVSPECNVFVNCAAEMRNLQSYSIKSNLDDIAYNFVIGNDGRVYEGRGWNVVGAHTKYYNRCSLGLAFIGDYREGLPSYSKVTELQQERAHMLFQEGIKLGHLHPQFRVVGAKDLKSTMSPGTNLYSAIQKWPRFDQSNMFKNRTCDEIRELYKHENLVQASQCVALAAGGVRGVLLLAPALLTAEGAVVRNLNSNSARNGK